MRLPFRFPLQITFLNTDWIQNNGIRADVNSDVQKFGIQIQLFAKTIYKTRDTAIFKPIPKKILM